MGPWSHARREEIEESSGDLSIGATPVRGMGRDRYGAGPLDKERPAMKQYMLSVHHDGSDLDATIPEDPEEMEALYRSVGEFNAALQEVDAMVFGCGLHPPETATVVRVEDGETLLTDGPFAETKEFLGGFWIIKCDDLDAALAWAAKAAVALQGGPVEVRPLQEDAE